MLLPRFLRFADLDFSSMLAILCVSVYDQNESPSSSSLDYDGAMRLHGSAVANSARIRCWTF